MVASTSWGPTDRVFGYSPFASVEPTASPVFSPPPKTTDMAPGQWSRPAVVFTTKLNRLQRRILRLLGMPRAYCG